MSPPEPMAAITIRCEGCGSNLTALAARVRCDSSGHQQTLDPAQLAQLSQYQRDVMRLNAGARQELGAISHMQDVHGVRGPQSRNVLLILIACTSTPVVLALGFALFGVATGLSNDTTKAVASTILMVGFFLGLGIFFAWYYGGTKKVVTLPRATQAAICPNCGAPTAFSPGQLLESCQYCGANAAPGTALMRAGLDATEQAARFARLERYRAERRVVSGYANISSSTAAVYPWILGITLGLPIVGGAVWSTLSTIMGSDPAPIGVIVSFWLLALAVTISGVAYVLRRAKQRNRWRLVQDQLAANLSGVALDGSDAAISWLDVFWACPFPVQFLFVGPLGSSILGQCRGFPALLLLNPKQPYGNSQGNVEVLLAAQFSGVADDSDLPNGPALEGLRSRLGTAGYTLKFYGGGLHASAATTALDALCTAPEHATALIGVADELAQFATSAQARPAQPMSTA